MERMHQDRIVTPVINVIQLVNLSALNFYVGIHVKRYANCLVLIKSQKFCQNFKHIIHR